jgi:hypothetical protein
MTVDQKFFEYLAKAIFDSIESDWEVAKVRVKYTPISREWTGFIKRPGEAEWQDGGEIDFPNDFKHQLNAFHEYTEKNGFKKWNVITFTISESAKFDIEFLWDQEFQDQYESYREKYD